MFTVGEVQFQINQPRLAAWGEPRLASPSWLLSAGLGRAWLFHPWGREPEREVGRLRSVSHVVRHRQGSGFDGLYSWVPFGPKRARQGPVWSRMGPYISRTLIRDSRVIRQGPLGPDGSYRVPTGFRRNTDLARRDPTGLDKSLDCPISGRD